jgi:hypothetical protein
LPVLAKKTLSEADSQNILKIISKGEGVRVLKKQMDKLKNIALSNLQTVRKNDTTQLMHSLLDPVYEDI